MGISASAATPLSMTSPSCPIFHLTTAKLDALIVIPVNAQLIPDVKSTWFKWLYAARCDPYVRHWFCDAACAAAADRASVLSPAPTEQAFYDALFQSGCPKYMVVKLPHRLVDALGCKMSLVQFTSISNSITDGSISCAGYFSFDEVSESTTKLDFFMTRSLCNDAKSSCLLQMAAVIGVNCKNTLELDLHAGNLPVLRMLQKFYHTEVPADCNVEPVVIVTPHAHGAMVNLKVLPKIIEDGMTFIQKLASGCREVESKKSVQFLLATARSRSVVSPTPLDAAVEGCVAIWDSQKSPVVIASKAALTAKPASAPAIGAFKSQRLMNAAPKSVAARAPRPQPRLTPITRTASKPTARNPYETPCIDVSALTMNAPLAPVMPGRASSTPSIANRLDANDADLWDNTTSERTEGNETPRVHPTSRRNSSSRANSQPSHLMAVPPSQFSTVICPEPMDCTGDDYTEMPSENGLTGGDSAMGRSCNATDPFTYLEPGCPVHVWGLDGQWTEMLWPNGAPHVAKNRSSLQYNEEQPYPDRLLFNVSGCLLLNDLEERLSQVFAPEGSTVYLTVPLEW